MWKLAVVLGLLLTVPAYAIDNGQYENVPPHIRQWFETAKNKAGVPCCSIADGMPTEFDLREGGYWVPNPGNPAAPWVQVPPEAIINHPGNPTGTAVIWWASSYTFIRCFVPGAEG
jgi:hypothetical protein